MIARIRPRPFHVLIGLAVTNHLVLTGSRVAVPLDALSLGANAATVRGMVLRQVGIMTLIGGVIGIGAAIGLGHAAQSLLYELKGYDPIVIGVAAAALTLVALAAGYLPALRASRVDPMAALRYE